MSDEAAAERSAAQAANLADAVLTAEAERQAEQAEREVLFADDLLPGVGDEAITLRQGLEVGGPSRSWSCSCSTPSSSSRAPP